MAQQPSTTNQNATQRIYKGYKMANKVLIGMQYENVFKSDRCCSCYTCLSRTAPAAQTTQKMVAAPDTSNGAPQMDQRLLMNTWPKTIHNSKHKCK